MKKFTIKKKRTLSTKAIFIIIVVILLTLSTAYGLLRTTLVINGMISGSFSKLLDVAYVSSSEDELTGNVIFRPIFSVESRNYDEDTHTYTVIVKKRNNTSIFQEAYYDSNFHVTMRNDTGSTIKNGTMEQVEMDAQGAFDVRQNPSLSPTSVSADGQLQCHVYLHCQTRQSLSLTSDYAYVKYKVTYEVESQSNVKKYFYVEIKYH